MNKCAEPLIMGSVKFQSLFQTEDEKQIAALRREVAHWKAEAQKQRDIAERLDAFLAQKNAFIEQQSKTILYLRKGVKKPTAGGGEG